MANGKYQSKQQREDGDELANCGNSGEKEVQILVSGKLNCVNNVMLLRQSKFHPRLNK